MLKRLFNADKKLVLRFFASFLLSALLIALACGLSAYAASAESSATSNVSSATSDTSNTSNTSDTSGSTAKPGDYVDNEATSVGTPGSSVLQEVIGVDASQPLEIIILLTLIALAPSLLIMMTCFMRIVIVLGFLRSAMQTQNTPPNMVLTGIALFLTIFIMAPVFSEINDTAYQPYVNEKITTEEALETASVPLKRFMLKQTSNDDLEFFINLSKTEIPEGTELTDEYKQNELPLTIIVPSFMISELKRAFQMGFMIFLPFLIIDIVVGSTLMSMGMMMLPPAMISMPFKILVFVLADGWNLMIGSLVSSYNW
ncbi:MAG: flagellar type III secretion system pore protein FliP [Oscillospiraceae bacterium]